MILVIILSLAGLIGLVYGIVKKKKLIIIPSAIGLILIGILLLAYHYLYSLTPY